MASGSGGGGGKANPKYKAFLVNSDTLADELDANGEGKTKLLRKMRANEWIEPGGDLSTDAIIALALHRVETGGDEIYDQFVGFLSQIAGLKVIADNIRKAVPPSLSPSPSPGPPPPADDPLDLFTVKKEVLALSSCWKGFGLALGLQPHVLDRIESDHHKVDECLQAALKEWVESVETLRGPPSWQLLVDAVASPAGGNNQALAQRIADEHHVKVPSTRRR